MTKCDIVAKHWGKTGFVEYVHRWVDSVGLDIQSTTEDKLRVLSPLDQHHGGGLASTQALFDMMHCEKGLRGLDIGCGLGGPMRWAATTLDASMTGIDVTPEMIEAAKMITQRVGMQNACRFMVADACSADFAPASFDFVIMMAVSCNIPNRNALHSFIARVLKSGGVCGILEPFQGSVPGCVLPVPWSIDGGNDTSFVLTPEETILEMEKVGLRLSGRRDVNGLAMKWFLDQQDITDSPTTPDRSTYFPEWSRMVENQIINIKKKHITFECMVFRKK